MSSPPHASFQSIPQHECEELLDAHRFGRFGVQVNDHPEIFTVNYAMDGRRIVFRIDRGTKLASIRQHPIGSFQIDHVNEAQRSGWSVMAIGPVNEVHGTEDIARLEELGLETWVVGESVHWMRLSPHRLGGRRIVPV